MATNRFAPYPATLRKLVRNHEWAWASHLQSWDLVQNLQDQTPDATLNEDYSGAATDCDYTFTSDYYLAGLVLQLMDSDVAQNAQVNDLEKWIGGAAALTNGIDLHIENSAGTTILNITPSGSNIKTLGGLAAFSTGGFTQSYDVSSATTGDNNHCVVAHIQFEPLYGRMIGVHSGDVFIMQLEDDFSGLASFGGILYGHAIHL